MWINRGIIESVFATAQGCSICLGIHVPTERGCVCTVGVYMSNDAWVRVHMHPQN